MTDDPKKPITAVLGDFNHGLVLHAQKLTAPSLPEPPSSSPPSNVVSLHGADGQERPKRRMAAKKTAAPAPAASPNLAPAVRPEWTKIEQSFKTEDAGLDFELVFDAEGDPHVSVCDLGEPVELSANLAQLAEVTRLLATIYAHAKRIRTGALTAEDTIPRKETRKADPEAEES